MALTFPLSTANFMDLLKVHQMRMDTPEQVEVNQTGGGEILRADLAPMLWRGEVRLGAQTRKEAADPDVLLDLLRPAGRSFYAYDTRRPAPLLDPKGLLLGANIPTIYALVAGGRELRLQSLPAGYVLSRGDYLSFDYGTAPIRRALHRVVDATVTVAGTGITPVFEVTPPLRAGANTGAVVTLIKASCKAVLLPGTVDKGTSQRVVTRDMMFQFQQTLR
ncbi:MAG: hypothetical protein ACOH2M_01240 [Cypionkella sp.]